MHTLSAAAGSEAMPSIPAMYVQALTPAMVAWRKRLSFITERFEAGPKSEKPTELLPAPGASSDSSDGKLAESVALTSESGESKPAELPSEVFSRPAKYLLLKSAAG